MALRCFSAPRQVWADVTELLVDPAVSRVKFDRQLEQYRAIEAEHISKGWFLLQASFPEIFVVFAAPQLKPASIVFGALIDFTNYDFWPPSVRLVHPFTRHPYKYAELPSVLRRRTGTPSPGVEITEQALMQAYSPEDIPFLCLPGIREYHEHPGHTGDSWFLHKNTGEGTLYFVLTQLHRYGVQPLTGYNVALQAVITGYQEPIAPE